MRASLVAVLAAAAVCTAVPVGVVVGVVVRDDAEVAALPAPRSPLVSPAPEPRGGEQERVEGRHPAPGRSFDRHRHSTTDPDSIWVIVNKSHPVRPSDFRPELGLVRGYQVAAAAVAPLERLLAEADRAGMGFKIASAFRSYDYQRQVHDAVVADRGRAAADRVSARPGHSEHQTGLAVDLVTPADPSCDFETCFADTPGGRWLATQAWRYGFVIRYRPGTSEVTGYQPEPWHLRYVGRALAAELRRTGVETLEELFGVPGGGYGRR